MLFINVCVCFCMHKIKYNEKFDFKPYFCLVRARLWEIVCLLVFMPFNIKTVRSHTILFACYLARHQQQNIAGAFGGQLNLSQKIMSNMIYNNDKLMVNYMFCCVRARMSLITFASTPSPSYYYI